MERGDLELINKHMDKDDALKSLYEEHMAFEQRLDKFNNKSYLTPKEEFERKMLQKRKLHGRDMIESILCKYRNLEANN